MRIDSTVTMPDTQLVEADVLFEVVTSPADAAGSQVAPALGQVDYDRFSAGSVDSPFSDYGKLRGEPVSMTFFVYLVPGCDTRISLRLDIPHRGTTGLRIDPGYAALETTGIPVFCFDGDYRVAVFAVPGAYLRADPGDSHR